MKDLVKHYQSTYALDIASSLRIYSDFLKSDDYTDQEKAEVVLIGDHQSRLNDVKHWYDSKLKAVALLAKAKLWEKEYTNFLDVYNDVKNLIGPIIYVGDLTVYDTAFRIATVSGALPEDLYLNAGARDGAIALFGKENISKVMPKAHIVSLIPELAPLKGYEIEAFLCIYSSCLVSHGWDSSKLPKFNPISSKVCGLRRNMLARKLLFPSIP